MNAFDPAPRHLNEVTDPGWLTQALGTRVERAEVVELLATQATKVRLALDLESDDPALPRAICIKGILTDTGATPVASLIETRFYRDQAARLPVHVPDCLHAGLNAAGDNGVIVMCDVKAAGGTFFTALDPFGAAQVVESLRQIAALHAATWQGTALYAEPGMTRFIDQLASGRVIAVAALQDLLDGPRGTPLPAAVKDAARLQAALAILAEQSKGQANCLVHGDAHAGNIYRDADGIGLVDWQIFQQGEWALDVAYHIAAVLSPEDRRAQERALLDEYRALLKGFGGPDLDADAAWSRYRAAMLYGYFLWGMTRKVEAPITQEFVRRLGLAVADLDSLALVEGRRNASARAS